jgi:UDP:flavonoid glycosyltransferase YjiC (YdhE family)
VIDMSHRTLRVSPVQPPEDSTMAKFLISTMPATGHVTPALPLAAELCRRGHEVVWHTGEEFSSAVARTGARFTPLMHTPDFTRIPIEPDPGARGIAAGVSVMRRLFGSRRPPATTVWQRLRNRLSHQIARRLFMTRLTPLLNVARTGCGAPPLRKGVQLVDIQRSPYLHLMPTTEAFEYPRAHLQPQVHFIGPLLPPAPSDFAPPPWWGELDGRYVMHVTQGTYATDDSALLRPTIDALAGEDLLVVATTPDPQSVSPLPANTRVARFIPHPLLLPNVDVMVTHAGYNGVLTALAHGIPLVCAGDSEDKPEVSARVAWSGSGIDLRTATPTRDDIRAAVRTVLTKPSYRANAQRIAADFGTHNGPGEGAALLEQLANDRSVALHKA